MRGPYRAKPAPGSIADLVLAYRKSPRVLRWSPLTRKKNDRVLGDFMAVNGRNMVADLRRGDILRMRDEMAHTPAEANNWLKVILGLLDYAADIEMIQSNPAARIKRLPLRNPDGFRTWREDEIEAFFRYWTKGSLPHLAVRLALHTGAARADLVKLGPANRQDGAIRYRRQKVRGGPWITVPEAPELTEVLDHLPAGQVTFLQTQRGTMKSPNALATHLTGWLIKAGLHDLDENGHRLSFHGLRKAFGRRLAEAGCSAHEIAAVLGHEDIRQSQVYTKAFDRAQAGATAIEKLNAKMSATAPKVVRITRNKRGTGGEQA